MYWLSSLGLAIPYVILPHGSLGMGRYLARFRACWLKRLGDTKSLGKGCPVVGSVMARCVCDDWQAADSRTLKSPFRAACVGTKLTDEGGAVRTIVRW